MDDKLTTKDAITVLRNLQDWLYFSSMNGGTSIQREAIDIAIGALKQPENVRCKDCKHYEHGICKKTDKQYALEKIMEELKE